MKILIYCVYKPFYALVYGLALCGLATLVAFMAWIILSILSLFVDYTLSIDLFKSNIFPAVLSFSKDNGVYLYRLLMIVGGVYGYITKVNTISLGENESGSRDSNIVIFNEEQKKEMQEEE